MIEVHPQKVCVLEGDHLSYYWPLIADSLEQCREVWEDNYTLEGLLTEAIGKRCQIWAIGTSKSLDLVIFSEVLVTQKGRILRIFLCVGRKLDEYLPMIDASLDRFAAFAGCDYVKVIGRRGWLRKLRAMGFREDSTTVSRPVRGYLNG